MHLFHRDITLTKRWVDRALRSCVYYSLVYYRTFHAHVELSDARVVSWITLPPPSLSLSLCTQEYRFSLIFNSSILFWWCHKENNSTHRCTVSVNSSNSVIKFNLDDPIRELRYCGLIFNRRFVDRNVRHIEFEKKVALATICYWAASIITIIDIIIFTVKQKTISTVIISTKSD